jgi:hypothetical protein
VGADLHKWAENRKIQIDLEIVVMFGHAFFSASLSMSKRRVQKNAWEKRKMFGYLRERWWISKKRSEKGKKCVLEER